MDDTSTRREYPVDGTFVGTVLNESDRSAVEQGDESVPVVSDELREQLGSVTADLGKELENIRNEMARMQHTLHHDLAELQKKGMQDLQQLDAVRQKAKGIATTSVTGRGGRGGESTRIPDKITNARGQDETFFDAKLISMVVILLLLFGPFWPVVVQIYEGMVDSIADEEF
jgi:hypothetical protein